MKVKIYWLPSHLGIKGNEIADKLAKLGTDLPEISSFIKCTVKDNLNLLKNKLKIDWEKHWNQAEILHPHLRSIEIKKYRNTTNEFKVKFYKDKTTTERLFRLRCMHTKWTHQFRMDGGGDEDRPSCERCGDELTVDHVFRVCTAYDNERAKYNIKLMDMAGDESDLQRIIDFLTEINLWDKT